MTSRAPAWFEKKYIKGAIHVLQAEGWMTKGMTRNDGTIKGNIATFKLAGKGMATEMSPSIEIRPVMNADRTTIDLTIKDYEANEPIQAVDLEKMPENEQQIAQQSAGWAMGRTFDKVLFDTFDAATSAIATIGDGSAAISITDVITGQAAILGQGIMGPPEIYVAIPYKLHAQLMLFREFANADWAGPDLPLMKAIGARSWLGMHFVPFADEFFAVPSANQVDGYMWMKQAVATVTNYEMMSRIDYVPEKKIYLAANTMGYAKGILFPTGIKRLRFSTNAAVTRPSP